MFKLLDYCDLITDGEHGSVSDDPNGTCFLLSNKNILNGFVHIDQTDRRINEKTKNLLNKRTKIGKNTILISTVGTIGKLAFIKDDELSYSFQRSVGIIKPNKEKIDPYFLYSLLQTKEYQRRFNQMASGSVQKCIFISGLEDLDIPDVDKERQARIGNIFFDLDCLIENNSLMIEQLTNKIKDLFTYWFVDFNFPNDNEKPYKENNGKFDKNGLPTGWSRESFTDNNLFKLIPVGINKFKGTKIYLSTSDVDQNNYNLDASQITFDNRESRANMQPIHSSIWFARMKKSVKHLYFDDSDYLVNDIILSTGFCGITAKKENLEYVYGLINSKWFEETKDVYSSGSTQESITDLILSYINVVIPDERTLKKFHDLAFSDLSMIQALKKQNDCLNKYKNFLLKTLFK